MTERLLIRPEAEADLAEAFAWYEARRDGLGHEFLLAVEARLAAIQRHPESFPVVHQQIRRALIRRFPYGIFFIVEESNVIVLAVFHAKRDPQHWQTRADPNA